MQKYLLCSFAALSGLSMLAADFPKAEISNGLVTATLNLPDPQNGSYHGARFDWSGIISSLQYKGHQYVAQWYETHDRKIHDALTGPAEEFMSDGESGLGDSDAKAGARFVRIGPGA